MASFSWSEGEVPQIFQLLFNQDWQEAFRHATSGIDVSVVDRDSGDLPLHLAIQLDAPVELVLAIFTVFPDAARVQDNFGRLPLHLALRGGLRKEIAQALMEVYPDSVKIANGDGELPLHRALMSAVEPELQLEILQRYPQACRTWCMTHGGGLALHIALACGSSDAVVDQILTSHPEATEVVDGNGMLPINYIMPSCPGGPSRHLQRLLCFTKRHFQALLLPWKSPAQQPCHISDVQWMIENGLLESRYVEQVTDMLLQSPDESYISSRLYRINAVVKLMIRRTENPVRASVAATAAYRRRAKRAFTIQENLNEYSRATMRVTLKLMDVEAMDSAFMVTGNSANQLLLAQESPHNGQLHTMFSAGPVATALDAHQAQFVAQPSVNRLMTQAWHGGDWAFPVNKQLQGTMQHKGAAATVSSLEQDDLNMLLAEVSQPHYYVSVPAARFAFERLTEFCFAAVLLYAIAEKNLSLEFSTAELVLLVFVIAEILFEFGQMMDSGWGAYILDRWNMIDITLYFFYMWYLKNKIQASYYTGNEQYDWLVSSQHLLALTAIVVAFKLLYVSTLQRTLGVFVLMVMRMIADLGVFLVLFVVLVLAFTITMHSFLGTVDGFYTHWDTTLTLIEAALGGYDFAPITDLTRFGDLPTTYYAGVSLMTVYLLLVLVLLLNLVIAKMSSTYSDIQDMAYPRWCMMKANAVADCQTARSFLSVVPAPFNLVSAVVYPVALLFSAVYYLVAHGDAKFVGKQRTQRRELGTLADTINPLGQATLQDEEIARNSFFATHAVFGATSTKGEEISASRRALAVTDVVVQIIYGVCVTLPAALVYNVRISCLWMWARTRDFHENLRNRMLAIAIGVARILFLSPFMPMFVFWAGVTRANNSDGMEVLKQLTGFVPSSVERARRAERTLIDDCMFELFRQRRKLEAALRPLADHKGLITLEQFSGAVMALRPRTRILAIKAKAGNGNDGGTDSPNQLAGRKGSGPDGRSGAGSDGNASGTEETKRGSINPLHGGAVGTLSDAGTDDEDGHGSRVRSPSKQFGNRMTSFGGLTDFKNRKQSVQVRTIGDLRAWGSADQREEEEDSAGGGGTSPPVPPIAGTAVAGTGTGAAAAAPGGDAANSGDGVDAGGSPARRRDKRHRRRHGRRRGHRHRRRHRRHRRRFSGSAGSKSHEGERSHRRRRRRSGREGSNTNSATGSSTGMQDSALRQRVMDKYSSFRQMREEKQVAKEKSQQRTESALDRLLTIFRSAGELDPDQGAGGDMVAGDGRMGMGGGDGEHDDYDENVSVTSSLSDASIEALRRGELAEGAVIAEEMADARHSMNMRGSTAAGAAAEADAMRMSRVSRMSAADKLSRPGSPASKGGAEAGAAAVARASEAAGAGIAMTEMGRPSEFGRDTMSGGVSKMFASSNQTSNKARTAKLNKIFGAETNWGAFRDVVTLHNAVIESVPISTRERFNLSTFDEVPALMRRLFKSIVALQEQGRHDRMHVGEFFRDISPFLPTLPVTYVTSCVTAMEAEDAIHTMRQEMTSAQTRMQKRLEALEAKLNFVVSVSAEAQRLQVEREQRRLLHDTDSDGSWDSDDSGSSYTGSSESDYTSSSDEDHGRGSHGAGRPSGGNGRPTRPTSGKYKHSPSASPAASPGSRPVPSSLLPQPTSAASSSMSSGAGDSSGGPSIRSQPSQPKRPTMVPEGDEEEDEEEGEDNGSSSSNNNNNNMGKEQQEGAK